MKWKKWLVLVSALLLAMVLISACSSSPAPGTGYITVRVVVTRDFGQQLIFDEMLDVPEGTSAMAALTRVAEVETSHGGGFVDAINGIHSEFTGRQPNTLGWFIYINGIQANTGALDYTLHDGDVQHWDFHDWSFHQFIPAIIGEFPEPLLSGYGGIVYPSIIVYQNGWQEDAQRIADKLRSLGIDSFTITDNNKLSDSEKESSNLILLGTLEFPLIDELNQAWKRLGFFTHFQDSKLNVYDSEGDPTVVYGGETGVIQATRSPWNPKGTGVCENTVWIISGTDEAGVKAALNTIISGSDGFKYTCAVVIADGEIIGVPQ
jgi:hypothetical protein